MCFQKRGSPYGGCVWLVIVVAITLARFLNWLWVSEDTLLEEAKRGFAMRMFYITIRYMKPIFVKRLSFSIGCALSEAHCRIPLQYHYHGSGGPLSWPSPWLGFLFVSGLRRDISWRRKNVGFAMQIFTLQFFI